MGVCELVSVILGELEFLEPLQELHSIIAADEWFLGINVKQDLHLAQ